ncbi:uncharacterized protein LOC126845755 [Adelges cooleyi]|uniref:uncharacterized protein LOC126845755 n=1 Tax=Adelges cooleyi TaxID=133065 RepID=UPI00217F7596|nr:uncharacterized protein LOC126845755 [Adelges cooleyi]
MMALATTTEVSTAVEILCQIFSGVQIEREGFLTSGFIVGSCTVVGGIFAGRLGMLVGGGIGTGLSTLIVNRAVTLTELIRKLSQTQMGILIQMITEEILNVAINILGRALNRGSSIVRLLETIRSNSLLITCIREVILQFLGVTHQVRFNPIAA